MSYKAANAWDNHIHPPVQEKHQFTSIVSVPIQNLKKPQHLEQGEATWFSNGMKQTNGSFRRCMLQKTLEYSA